MKLFSDKNRPVHMGKYPLERLKRVHQAVRNEDLPALQQALRFCEGAPKESLVHAMSDFNAIIDAARYGALADLKSDIPADPVERSNHLKAFGYFCDASMVGVCGLDRSDMLARQIENPDIDRILSELQMRPDSWAAGVADLIAQLKTMLDEPKRDIGCHAHALVFLYEYPRDPEPNEPGYDWIAQCQKQRSALRSNETAAVIAGYLRLLGYDARSHSETCSEVDMYRLAVKAGLAVVQDGRAHAPWLGRRFGLAVVTTTLTLEPDEPLDPSHFPGRRDWRVPGMPFGKRRFVDGEYPFEQLKRVDKPTTFIDEDRIARVPMRADMFARAELGDMGPTLHGLANDNLFYMMKSAPGSAQLHLDVATVPLQDGARNPDGPRPDNPQSNHNLVKAAAYFLGADAVGISRCPEWAWYSHNAGGDPIEPSHDQAISFVIDQGYDTMEGSSGDDWISVSQSVRAYLRFSILGGVLANHIRRLGYNAKAHTAMDGQVVQPPLLLLSGLGEVSRIGEVMLNPYLGPRLKSGVITTDMPLSHDRPIDFGLQKFCENCNKCARECPSGAITAGGKKMFNGYEIWKSDSQKCTTYRLSNSGGAMCGRCMKTCPWNLEGLFAEAPFRWAASHVPSAAKFLARLDDKIGNGGLNKVKKWWWDIELKQDGAFRIPANPPNERDLQKDIDLRFEDQTLAVYPAHLAPPPWPYPFEMDREAGIAAHEALLSAGEYIDRLERGDESHVHRYDPTKNDNVLRLKVASVHRESPDITRYELKTYDGAPLPEWTAGAHIDVLVSPKYLRQYSLCGDPADRSRLEIAVLREENGRGGSKLLQEKFTEGVRVFTSVPINHFELVETAPKTLLFGGGIGVTPMIAFAHRLSAVGADFRLHYSASREADAGFKSLLASAPWRDHVELNFSDRGARADIGAILSRQPSGTHIYICGPDRYMASIVEAAALLGYPEETVHLEYFAAPEAPTYTNSPFTIALARSGQSITVPDDKSAADALIDAGFPVAIKCSDGICGVCKCGLLAGEVEHRDYVLSKAQRANTIILCQSRATEAGGIIELDM